MQIEPNNGRVERVEEGNWKKKRRTQEAWTTSKAIIHTVDKSGMKSQSVTPSLIILTHHTAHRLWESRRTDFLLTWCSAHFSEPLCDVRVHVCDHSSPRDFRACLGNTLLRAINHRPLTILNCSQACLLVQKQQNFHWQKYLLNKRLRYGSIWGLRKAEALCPYSPSWIVTQSYLHQERATCEQQTWSIAGLYPECL